MICKKCGEMIDDISVNLKPDNGGTYIDGNLTRQYWAEGMYTCYFCGHVQWISIST